jgi:hypothetical protein
MDNMIPVPEQYTQQISRRAVEIARIIGPRKSGRGLTEIMPFWEEGVIGMKVPDDVKYLINVNDGIEEHPMTDLANRNIPLRSPGGTLYFRRAGADKIGQIPIINRSAQSGQIIDSKPEWMYPAKAGLNFIQRSLQMSIDEWANSTRSSDIVKMLLQSKIKDDVSMVIYGRRAA